MEIGIENLIQSDKPALLPGLPDDIALSCLARVPRKYHPVLNCVSKRWRELIYSKEWHSYRKKHKLVETWIYALCTDKSDQLCMYVLIPDQLKRGWKQITGLPNRCLKRKGIGFEVSGNKIYLFGGCGWTEDATDEVYCYDASVNTWSIAASLPTPRCYFICGALDGKLYAIGGIGSKSSNPRSWDFYDPETNSWESHLDGNHIPDIEDSMVFDGKIYARCSTSIASSNVCAIAYDPSSDTCQLADADMARGWHGPAVVIDGVLYVLDHSSGLRLMTWRKDTREWMALRRLSTDLTRPPCRLLAIGKKIFLIGRGLSTVVFDVELAGCVGGVLVSSSFLKLNTDGNVMSCKYLAA